MINKTTTYPTITTIKFFIIAIAALAAAMSLAAAASRKRKIQKKNKQLIWNFEFCQVRSNRIIWTARSWMQENLRLCDLLLLFVVMVNVNWEPPGLSCGATRTCCFATRFGSCCLLSREVTKLCML